ALNRASPSGPLRRAAHRASLAVSPLRASIADACDKHGLCSSTGISPSNPALAAATGRAATGL
ncbi:hypothetical protein, partial [Yersinia intermedia]|uniref:hypothetical protein n=1 Tax=Yersinia intermedia TaxID=631 RepID=UPI001C6FCCF9